MAKKKYPPTSQPYSNMPARRTVLVCGLVASLLGFACVLFCALIFFLPSFLPDNMAEIDIMLWGLIIGVALCFAGAVLAVSGANTSKGVARIAFFFSTMGFAVGFAMLVLILGLRTFIPRDAINRVLTK